MRLSGGVLALALLAACSGRASLPPQSAIPPAQVFDIREIAADPQRFDGRYITIRAFAHRMFAGRPYERIALLAASQEVAADGKTRLICDGSKGNDFVVSHKEIRGYRTISPKIAASNSDELVASEGWATEVLLSGYFSAEEAVLNPGASFDFVWDGSFSKVESVRLTGAHCDRAS